MSTASNQPPRPRKRRGNPGVSQEEVASRAGVSTATVSRVLNNPEMVSRSSRELVDAAINELGYIPDGAARALASRRTRTIGALVPTLDNPIFAVGIQGLQSRLKKHGYTLLVASHEYDLDEELREVRTILQQPVDGLMLIGAAHDAETLRLLHSKSIPFVYCWTYNPAAAEPSIGFDNRKAAQKMAEYLLDLGHQRFALIGGHTRHNDRAADRLMGARDAIEARGFNLPRSRIFERRYSVEQGREAMRILLDQPEPPTAVICGNDILALGALAECQASGVQVPGQISVAGFDDLDMSAQIVPALTTIRVPAAEMGERVADYLLARIKHETALLHQEVEAVLQIRETTAPPPG